MVPLNKTLYFSALFSFSFPLFKYNKIVLHLSPLQYFTAGLITHFPSQVSLILYRHIQTQTNSHIHLQSRQMMSNTQHLAVSLFPIILSWHFSTAPPLLPPSRSCECVWPQTVPLPLQCQLQSAFSEPERSPPAICLPTTHKKWLALFIY